MFWVSYGKYYYFSLLPLGTNHPHEIVDEGGMLVLFPATCVVCRDKELKLVSSLPHISVTTWSMQVVLK